MTTNKPMQLGVVGLGRMGTNIVRRLMRDGHRCVVFDVIDGAFDIHYVDAEGQEIPVEQALKPTANPAPAKKP